MVLRKIAAFSVSELEKRIENLKVDEARKATSLKIFSEVIKTKSIPDDWVSFADDFTTEELREFLIKDNANFGEFDFDMLANNFDVDFLLDAGLDLPKDWGNDDAPEETEKTAETINSQIIVCPNCSHNFSLLKEK